MIYPLHTKILTITLMTTFSVMALLGFSLLIDLKPAQAFIFADIKAFIQRIALHLKTDLKEFVKDLARAFVTQLISNMMVKLIRKLESMHVIKNIMFYSDALQIYDYIPKALAKQFDGVTDVNDPKLNKNLGEIAAEANTLPFNDLSPGQIEALGLASKPASVKSTSFYAAPHAIAKGESAKLYWTVEGDNISAKLDNDDIPLSGSKVIKPEKGTIYTLTVWNKSTNSPTGSLSNVKVFVEGTPDPTVGTVPPVPKKKSPGLTPEQEKKLLKGGISLLTSHIACGKGPNKLAIKKLALYQAVKHRGVDPRKIDPREGNFYTDMINMGNPFGSPYFQELAMRDYAATIEAQAANAATQELLSSGLKAIRAEQNQISRTGQTVSDFISQSAGNLISAQTEGANSGTVIAKRIGSQLANFVTAVLLQDKGKLISENPFCGIPTTIAAGLSGTGAGNVDNKIDKGDDGFARSGNPFAGAFIRVSRSSINPGESVEVTWNVGTSRPGQAFVNKQPVSNQGSFNSGPLQETTEYVLSFNDEEMGDTDIGATSVEVVEPSTNNNQPPPSAPPPIPTIINFTSDKTTVDASKNEVVKLQWQLSNTGGENCKITINLGPGQPQATTLCQSGTFPHTPKTTTTYVLSVINKDTNQTVDSKSWTVTVTGQGTGTQSFILEPFKPRE